MLEGAEVVMSFNVQKKYHDQNRVKTIFKIPCNLFGIGIDGGGVGGGGVVWYISPLKCIISPESS